MPGIDFADLAAPVSEAEPCGPDLDAAGDPDYMNFVASTEGLLPQFFFEFDRKSIDFDAQLEATRGFLAATRDLRLLGLLAKLLVLNRDLDGFVRLVETTADLLQTRWADIHPRPDGDDYGFRAAALQSFDDVTTVVFPLQYLPILQTRRLGPISYRSHMIASGEAAPRPGEDKLESAAIDKEFMQADLGALVELRDRVQRLRSGLTRIRDTWVERAGFGQAVNFDAVLPLVSKMLALLEGVIAKRDPTAAAEGAAAVPAETEAGAIAPTGEAPARAGTGRIGSVADAARALASVAAYFDRFEPSSPSLLLVRQAERLIGKSFLDVMRILVPAAIDRANVHMGSAQSFSLPLEKLGSLDPPQGEEAAAPAATPGATGGPDPNLAKGPDEIVESRPAAIALLDEVGAFYRGREPSSPIPLLTDRARSLAARDFLYLLEQMLLPAGEPGQR